MHSHSFIWLLLSGLVSFATAQVGTCSSTQRCHTGCCSKSGSCGFGPDFCGKDVCISDCDAVAECGEWAKVKGTTCPLNVCCSKYGYCGTSEEFCSDGCQSGCDKINEPSCDGTSSNAVYAGYYEGWSYEHPCDNILPEDIDVSPWTHLYYSFAGIDPSKFTITTTHEHDEEYWPKFTGLKGKKPSLKIYISVGGWDVGGKVFSDMVAFSANRKAFIDSAISFMKKYDFDGIDIDWEYPSAVDRGGVAADKENYVTFLKELRQATGDGYGLTCTIPSSYWYLKGFDIEGMQEYVDFFNLMAYDIHGTWDGDSQWTSSVVNPHTNLTEISTGLDLLWRNNINPSKVILGLGFYGRSFTLADPSCNTPGCAFDKNNGTGGGIPGECTSTSGILSDYEISRIIKHYSIKTNYDKTAAVNWMTWSGNQWVSFDDGHTLKQKSDFANSKCLGGLFGWALDLGGPGTLSKPDTFNENDASVDGADVNGGSDGTSDFYIGDEVFATPTVTGIAPVSLIWPPSTLSSPTTLRIGGYPTSLEVAWNTTATVTSGSMTTVTTTITRYIVETTIPISPITTNTISFYNWNVSASVTEQTGPLITSVNLPPVTVTDDPSPMNVTGVVHSPLGTRTITIPPWPWTTGSSQFPTVTFTKGSNPSPSCTANCGHKCEKFCDKPCLTDCGISSSSDFIDPSDPNPPSVNKCSGPDCKNGECENDMCIEKGCTGDDCKDRVCLGAKCKSTACTGSDCEDGHCTGPDCTDHGCIGDDCDDSGTGHCLGPDCLSWGCVGPDCSEDDWICMGPDCRVVSCTGAGCSRGICSGPDCKSEDDNCEVEEADFCTEWITSSLVTPSSTYSTSTMTTRCESITACSASRTTTTSTITGDDLIEGTLTIDPLIPTENAALTRSLDQVISSDWSSAWSAYSSSLTAVTTSSSTSTSSTSTSTTTTSDPAPSATGYSCKGSSLCGTQPHLHSFCNMAKSYINGNTKYGTKKTSDTDYSCYTDGMSGVAGCAIMVRGDNCEFKGSEIAAFYDHIFDNGEGNCGICGKAFITGGCTVKADYVTWCHRSQGPLEIAPGNGTNVTSSRA